MKKGKKERMQGKAVADSLLKASYTNTEELSKTTKQKQKATSKISASFVIICEN